MQQPADGWCERAINDGMMARLHFLILIQDLCLSNPAEG